MIKIIKEGKIKKSNKRIFETTCTTCGCIFEFENEDLEERIKTLGFIGSIHCPYCHANILIRPDNTTIREVEENERN